MADFTEGVESTLRAAGWMPGRQVDTAPWLATLRAAGLEMHDAAKQFLAEFGDLTVDISGPGINRAREPFELDPTLCLGEEDRFLEWSEHIGHSLFPIGELDSGRFFLGIDERSHIYVIETWVASFGSMPRAIERLILGVRPTVIDDGSIE